MDSRAYTIISYVFHPLFFFLYGMVLIGLFFQEVSQSYTLAPLTLILVILNTVIFPGLAARFFGKTLMLEEKEERNLPYLSTIFFYSVSYMLLMNASVPVIYTDWLGGIIIALGVLFFLNHWIKVSMHMLGAGGLTALVLFFSFSNPAGFLWLLLPVTLTLIIGSSRIKLKAHNLQELMLGYVVGLVSVSAIVFFN